MTTVPKLGGFNITATEMAEKLRNSGFSEPDAQRIVLALVTLEHVPTQALRCATTLRLSQTTHVDARSLMNSPGYKGAMEVRAARELTHELYWRQGVRFTWSDRVGFGETVVMHAHAWLLKGDNL